MDNQVQVQSNKALSSPRRFNKVLVAAAAAMPLMANAAIDVASVTATIEDGVLAAGIIGLAFLAFKAGIAIFRQLRSAA